MPDKSEDPKKPTPDLADVEPGSDADETPPSEPGKTPSNPNDSSKSEADQRV